MWLYLRDVKVWNFKYIDTTQGTERPDKRRKWSRMESTWKIKHQKSIFIFIFLFLMYNIFIIGI
jgi:hypothetical protein